jgi:hypothetical protein
MRPLRFGVPLTVAALIAHPVAAQTGGGGSGGTLSPRVTHDLIDAHEGSGGMERHHVRAVVLWRAPALTATGREPVCADTLTASALALEYRRLGRAAEDSGRHLIGGYADGQISASEYDLDRGVLVVLGRAFTMPARDSAVVVVVDRRGPTGTDCSPPRVAATAYMPATLPSTFWPQSWTSGDTSYFVHRGFRDRPALLAAALRTVLAVRPYLE